MNRRLACFMLTAAILLAPSLLVDEASAGSASGMRTQDPYGVIDAVNALRTSQGLPAYTISSTLMGIAQSHAEYMANTGSVTHTGSDGSRPYQRALAAGYPLAGQIPPGFFSENIQAGNDLGAQAAVQIWTGDAPHLNTMTSASLQEIGAGVAVSGGLVYFVIDCARPTTSGLPQAYTPGAAESSFSSSNELIMPVTKSTPNANSEIIHEVQAGQSLWQIAIEYGVKIDQIRGLNQLSAAYVINPGDTLLIMTVASPTPLPATPTLPPDATVTVASPAMTEPAPSPSTTPTLAPAPFSFQGAEGAVGATIVVALLAAALIAWAGRARLV